LTRNPQGLITAISFTADGRPASSFCQRLEIQISDVKIKRYTIRAVARV